MLSLPGCAPKAFLRDPHLLRDCAVPALPGEKRKDTEQWALEATDSLNECNVRWRYLRGNST